MGERQQAIKVLATQSNLALPGVACAALARSRLARGAPDVPGSPTAGSAPALPSTRSSPAGAPPTPRRDRSGSDLRHNEGGGGSPVQSPTKSPQVPPMVGSMPMGLMHLPESILTLPAAVTKLDAKVDGLEQKLLQVLGTLQDVASKVDGLVEVAAEPSVAAKVLTAERVRELSQRV